MLTGPQLLEAPVAGGRTVGYCAYGPADGVPVLFLHGTPGGRLTRAEDEDLYDRLGLRLLVPSRPGYGGTSPLQDRRVVDVVGDLVAVLDAEHVERAIVFGGSGGGPHALALAAVEPQRVASVAVAVGASPLLPEEIAAQPDLNRGVLALVHDRDALARHLAVLRETLLSQGLESLVPDLEAMDRERLHAAAVRTAEVLADALAPGVGGWVDDYRAVWALDWGFAVEDVHVPVVWGHGCADDVVPMAAAQRLAARLPDCRLHVWPGEGHLLGPTRTTELLAAALGLVVRRASLPA